MDIQQLLREMTLEEKIGQLSQHNCNLLDDMGTDVTGPMQELGLQEEDLQRVGSVLNFRDAEQFLRIQEKHLREDRNRIPLLFMMDVIHGWRTIYPIPLALGCSFDPELVAACTRMAGREAAASGVQVTFGPMADYVRDARWGRVMESCGEDAMLNALLGAAQVKAFHEAGLATCVKHFAAYGGAEAGRDYNTVELSEHTLREFYLPAYKACLDAGADMVMTSFNVLNGVPATANRWLMQKILREEWQSEALVISDYGAVEELVSHGVAENRKEAARLAFDNGCQIEMCTTGYQKHLKELIEEGVFSREQLDEAVEKILRLKERLGLLEDPYRGVTPETEAQAMLTPENRAVARLAAEESAVLLKNDGLLPLSKEMQRVAVIGPLADNKGIRGNWGAMGRDEECVTVFEGIRALLPRARVETAPGCTERWNEDSRKGFADALALAKQADAVVLCLGENQYDSGEGNSRANIELPAIQQQLAQQVLCANPHTAVVLFTGRPLAIPELSKLAPAVINMWFPGTEGGSAAARLLFGDANPCGKLSMSFPKATGQCPIYYNRLQTGRPKPAQLEDTHVMYTSNYIDCGNLPLYSFGHGLSYSHFVYEQLTLSSPEMTGKDTVQATVTVYNDSDRPGKETVMLFMRDLVASTARPVQQLLAFQKVAFGPYQRKEVVFTIQEPMLRFWDPEHRYISEPGLFHISTGCADHLLLRQELTLR